MTGLSNIIIGISGGIAAYKTPLLIRMFRKNNIGVKVVCTTNSLKFVTPLTLETLSEDTVYSDVFSMTEEYSTAHISITDKADAMIVAPATANVIAKFAAGIADDALSTTFLSFNKQVFMAPAMNTKMLEHPATVKNITLLKERGVIFIDPDPGYLACGYEGKGRMAEPDVIYQTITEYFQPSEKLQGKKVLVTAGPTQEALDPVRYIGNRSSGKMGYAIAEAFSRAGAHVRLISGQVALSPPPGVEMVMVTSAEEMYEACVNHFPDSDITVMAAAVSDFTPEKPEAKKIKKTGNNVILTLKPTHDILKTLGEKKTKSQILIGFALETDNEEENALKKLHNKNADCIVLNSLRDQESGFEYDTNKVTLLTADKNIQLPLKHKREVARDIIQFIITNLLK